MFWTCKEKRELFFFFLDKTTSVWVMQAHISLTLLVTSTSTRQRAHHPPIHPELLTKLAELQLMTGRDQGTQRMLLKAANKLRSSLNTVNFISSLIICFFLLLSKFQLIKGCTWGAPEKICPVFSCYCPQQHLEPTKALWTKVQWYLMKNWGQMHFQQFNTNHTEKQWRSQKLEFRLLSVGSGPT